MITSWVANCQSICQRVSIPYARSFWYAACCLHRKSICTGAPRPDFLLPRFSMSPDIEKLLEVLERHEEASIARGIFRLTSVSPSHSIRGGTWHFSGLGKSFIHFLLWNWISAACTFGTWNIDEQATWKVLCLLSLAREQSTQIQKRGKRQYPSSLRLLLLLKKARTFPLLSRRWWKLPVRKTNEKTLEKRSQNIDSKKNTT